MTYDTVDAIVAWEYDGTDGCDKCQSMTGTYDDRPSRPHDHCDCSISPMFYAGGFTNEYKNKVENVGSIEEQLHEGIYEMVNNTNSKLTWSYSVSETVEGEVSVSAEIEGAFNVSGKYKQTESVSQGVGGELDPGDGVSIDVVGLMIPVTFEADWYYVGEDALHNGERVEIFMEHIEDEIYAVEGARVVVNNI